MKKIVSLLLAVLMVSMLVAFQIVSYSAADTLKINGEAEAKVGDKVTYSLNIADVPEKVEDAQLVIYYDENALLVNKDTIKYAEGGSPVYNADIPGQVLFNCANGLEGWDFMEKTTLFEVGFEVNQPGETNISYYIQCMDYLSNSQNVDTYTLTCDIKVNDEVKVEDAVPVVKEDGSGGGFINHQNGKGEKNGGDVVVGNPESANPAVDNVVDNNNNSNNIGDPVLTDENGNLVQEETESTVMRTNSSMQNITGPNGETYYDTDSSINWQNIGIISLAVVIVLCIIISIVFSVKKKK